MEKIALIYCRVSSERQKKEGHGLESQQHRCEQYARERGYTVERVFPDTASGAGDFLKRPAVREMLAYVDSKPHINYIIIFDDLKRFARDTVFHWNLKSALKSRNVTPECLNYNFDDSPEGVFVETIFAAQNQLEREQNRRQVIQKQKARLENGYWPFYPPPGYVAVKDGLHGKLLTPDDKAALIKESLEGFASGRFQNQVDVQNFLQANNFFNGKHAYLETVRRLLSRVVYAGYIEYPEWDVVRRKGHHEALITLETYQKIQDKLNGTVKVWSRKDISADFPLRGFVVCACCKKAFTSNWSSGRTKSYPYYRCNQRKCVTYGSSIKRDDLEEEFKSVLRKIKPSAQVISLTQALFMREWGKRLQKQTLLLSKVQTELLDIQSQLLSLAQRASKASSEIVAEQYEKQIETLANRELLVKEKLGNATKFVAAADFKTALHAVFAILKDPYTAWVEGDFSKRRLILKVVFDESLAYNKETGFETAVLSLPLRVFELSKLDDSHVVEMGGIEPPCKK